MVNRVLVFYVMNFDRYRRDWGGKGRKKREEKEWGEKRRDRGFNVIRYMKI